MNNTIAWIMTIFIIVTIIVDLNALMLMRTNKKTYEQNENNTRKTKAYWAYLVVSRLAFAMTTVVGALIMCGVFKVLSDLMIQHKNAVIYIIAACICVAIAVWTWHMTKSEIREAQNIYDAYQDYETLPLETFVDPKDEITVNKISLWLLANVIASGTVIAFAVLFANLSSIKL